MSTKKKAWTHFYGPKTKSELPSPPYQTLPALLKSSVERWPHNKAYACVLPNGFTSELTFLEMDKLSDAFAVYLRECLGLKEGDRVSVQLPNCLSFPVAAFGVIKAGCILVNTNPLYTDFETQKQLENSKAKVVIVIDMFANKLQKIMLASGVQKIVVVSVVDFFPFMSKSLVQFVLKYIKQQVPFFKPKDSISCIDAVQEGARILADKKIRVDLYTAHLKKDDVALLQYTGGTTGLSKGAMLTHGNLISNMMQIAEMGASELEQGKGSIISILPLYHIFAFTLNLLVFYSNGALNVLIPNPRPLIALKPAFEKYPINWISGVNTLFNFLPREPWFTKDLYKHLRVAVSGGTALYEATAKQWAEVTGTRVVEGYGLTETSPVVTFNPIDNIVKINTVGIPLPSTEVCLFGDDYQEVPTGEPGEIAIKGPQVMKGYWEKEEETKKSFRDGWLLTGDMGIFDEDGYLRIVDRKKDMVIVSGFNVYPNEVEDCLVKCEGILEAAVVGVPDDKTGEAVKACIVKRNPDLTEAMVKDHCKKYLTHYKLPKVIAFYSELPKSNIGKVLRKELRDKA